MTTTSEDIIKFIVDRTGCSIDEVTLTSDLDNDLGCTGDDFHELIEEFEMKFKVDMNTYRWYFHTVEEGYLNNIGRFLFKTPPERVKHIAVTPIVLLESANSGKWIINYPQHSLPKYRYDILVNQFLVLALISVIAYKCAR